MGFAICLTEFSGRLKLKAGMQLKYMGSKFLAGSAPGPAAGQRDGAALTLLRFRKAGVLPRPDAPEPGGAWRRRLRARRKPRCDLRRGPVFLHSLLRLVGHKVDRRFYFRRLLPGALRGRAGRRAACSYALLRKASRKVGLLRAAAAAAGAEQRAGFASATVQRGRAAPGRIGRPARRPSKPASTPTLPTSSPVAP